MSSIEQRIKSSKSEVFRRAYIKRRVLGSGLFEENWFEISEDVKSWGKITSQIDNTRLNKFTFGNAKLVVNNIEGRYNPHSNEFSLWFGYLNQQRTLVKIEAGFYARVQRSDGVWINSEVPDETLWDEDIWDSEGAEWDGAIGKIVFKGVISGDVLASDKQEITFNIKPLTSLFQDFNARDLVGWTTTGMTASQFVAMVRDQVDLNGNYFFRPFFDDTISTWDISTTANVYSNLNTSTAEEIYSKTVWDVIEKLAESELFVPYVARDGTFKFVSRTANSLTPTFQFHGVGSPNSEYGHTIKEIRSYGFKVSKYYSSVSVKWQEDNTTTSYEVVAASLSVAPNSNPWVLGSRELKIENTLIPSASVANVIATTIYNDVSGLKNEIEFSTSFVPHLDILDRISVHYDPNPFDITSLWDFNNWAATSIDDPEDLLWDVNRGNALVLDGEEFKFLSFELDLDRLENRFVAREV